MLNSSTSTRFSGVANILKGYEGAVNAYKKPLEEVENKIKQYEARTSSPPGRFNPLNIKKAWLQIRKGLRGQFLDFDFTDFNYYKEFKSPFGNIPFKSTFTNPSMGALIAFAFIGLEGARALRAWNRRWIKDDQGNKIKQDFRELRDVLVRDTFAIIVYIWGLGVANKLFLKNGQKSAGFKLAEGSNAFDFKAHEVNRDFLNEHTPHKTYRRRTYIANILHGDSVGMVKAAQKNTFFGIPRDIYNRVRAGSTEVKEKLNRISELISEFRTKQKELHIKVEAFVPKNFETGIDWEDRITQVKAKHGNEISHLLDYKTDDGQAVKGKKGILRQLDDLQAEVIKDLSTQPNGKVNSKLRASLSKNWGRFSEFMVKAAKAKRTSMDALSFGFILFLIGYLPVKFNELFTNAEYKRMQEEQRKLNGMALTLKNTRAPLYSQPANINQRATYFGQNA